MGKYEGSKSVERVPCNFVICSRQSSPSRPTFSNPFQVNCMGRHVTEHLLRVSAPPIRESAQQRLVANMSLDA